MQKIPCVVLGATGLVGQVFVWMLSHHPIFEPQILIASDRKSGEKYSDVVDWILPFPIPDNSKNTIIKKLDIEYLTKLGVRLIFSALPSKLAKTVESQLRSKGFWVFSNTSAMRYDSDVPILIPEINPCSLKLIEKQGFPKKGFVVTNANCTTTGLALALAPLIDTEIIKIMAATYQSVSGAGRPGLSSVDIMGNVIPYINGEEQKVVNELKKILKIDAQIFPTCVRVPILFGHLEVVWVEFNKPIEKQIILEKWENFKVNGLLSELQSIPENPISYESNEYFPQPKMSFLGSPEGMQVFIGRLNVVQNLASFVLVVNNLIRGSAGGSIANAELFLKSYESEIWTKL